MPSLDQIRSQMPATQEFAYLNAGSVGPLSSAVADAIRTGNEQEFEVGRIAPGLYPQKAETKAELRQRLATLMGGDEDEIALTHHTTDGMNIATWGMPWRDGDEVVTTSLEHPGGLFPLFAAARRFGLRVHVVPLSETDDGDDLLKKLDETITPNCRFVSISHVSWKSGAVAPIREIADLTHDRGGYLAVDGAQSGGAIPLDVHETDVDFYAIPGQKWLCAPEGTGALYVRRSLHGFLKQTFVGYPSGRGADAWDESGIFLASRDAVRYEVGSVYTPALAGLLAGLRWFDELGLSWIYDRIQTMTATCRQMLAEIPDLEIVTPEEHAGLTSFRIAGLNVDQVVERLARDGVLIRCVHDPELLRVATGFYNSDEDLERLVDGLQRCVEEMR